MSDKKVFFNTHNNCIFYTDGTYDKSNGELSWWMVCEKGISVKHSIDGDWLTLYEEDNSHNDLKVNGEILEAIDKLIEQELLCKE